MFPDRVILALAGLVESVQQRVEVKLDKVIYQQQRSYGEIMAQGQKLDGIRTRQDDVVWRLERIEAKR